MLNGLYNTQNSFSKFDDKPFYSKISGWTKSGQFENLKNWEFGNKKSDGSEGF